MTSHNGRGPSRPPWTVVVTSWPEVLTATGTKDVHGLSAIVDDACEPDVWVTDTDTGVEVGSGVWATCLDFPFTIADFWTLVREVEAGEMARIETTPGLVQTAGRLLRRLLR